MTSLKAKIFASASANAGLQALLGTSPFRLYDVQLDQGQAGYYPCVTMMIISNPRAYAHGAGRFATSWARVQFTVFGTGNDSQNASAVVEALLSWLDSFNPTGQASCPQIGACIVVGDRDGGIAQTQPLTYQRFLDVAIFYKET